MPKSMHLPTDPRFPAFRAHLEQEWGGPLPDDQFYAGEGAEWSHEPHHAEPAKAFRLFVAGWNAALAKASDQKTPQAERDRSRDALNNLLSEAPGGQENQ